MLLLMVLEVSVGNGGMEGLLFCEVGGGGRLCKGENGSTAVISMGCTSVGGKRDRDGVGMIPA